VPLVPPLVPLVPPLVPLVPPLVPLVPPLVPLVPPLAPLVPLVPLVPPFEPSPLVPLVPVPLVPPLAPLVPAPLVPLVPLLPLLLAVRSSAPLSLPQPPTLLAVHAEINSAAKSFFIQANSCSRGEPTSSPTPAAHFPPSRARSARAQPKDLPELGATGRTYLGAERQPRDITM
jgi:hypothetical protein